MEERKYLNTENFDISHQSCISDDIRIDEHKLKSAWLKQAQLHMEYSTIATEKRKERDLIARKIKVKHAELNLDIRNKAIKYIPELVKKEKGFRLTESIVESAIESNQNYQKLNQIYIKKDYEYNMYKNVVDALSDKRKSLEEIQELHVSSFYAEPSDAKIRKSLNR